MSMYWCRLHRGLLPDCIKLTKEVQLTTEERDGIVYLGAVNGRVVLSSVPIVVHVSLETFPWKPYGMVVY